MPTVKQKQEQDFCVRMILGVLYPGSSKKEHKDLLIFGTADSIPLLGNGSRFFSIFELDEDYRRQDLGDMLNRKQTKRGSRIYMDAERYLIEHFADAMKKLTGFFSQPVFSEAVNVLVDMLITRNDIGEPFVHLTPQIYDCNNAPLSAACAMLFAFFLPDSYDFGSEKHAAEYHKNAQALCEKIAAFIETESIGLPRVCFTQKIQNAFQNGLALGILNTPTNFHENAVGNDLTGALVKSGIGREHPVLPPLIRLYLDYYRKLKTQYADGTCAPDVCNALSMFYLVSLMPQQRFENAVYCVPEATLECFCKTDIAELEGTPAIIKTNTPNVYRANPVLYRIMKEDQKQRNQDQPPDEERFSFLFPHSRYIIETLFENTVHSRDGIRVLFDLINHIRFEYAYSVELQFRKFLRSLSDGSDDSNLQKNEKRIETLQQLICGTLNPTSDVSE